VAGVAISLWLHLTVVVAVAGAASTSQCSSTSYPAPLIVAVAAWLGSQHQSMWLGSTSCSSSNSGWGSHLTVAVAHCCRGIQLGCGRGSVANDCGCGRLKVVALKEPYQRQPASVCFSMDS